MKKFLSIAVMLALVASAAPAFAGTDNIASGDEQVKNVRSGALNASSGLNEYMDATAQEAAKGKTTPEQLTGVAMGGVVGVRRGIHRAGAGVIDLLTFWIPKKQPLITPEQTRLK